MSALATELEKVLCKKCRLEFAQEALFCPNCGTAKNRDTDGDPLLGTTIGERYQLIQQIGQGGSGAIYRGEHVTLRRKVAVKVLHHELSRDDLAIERFRREATTVGDLDNDHIVQIYDFGRTQDGRLYLAMEYLEGQTLADILEERGRLPVSEVVDILTQIGEALIEAHAMGYVHRDLRPRNMFLAMRRTQANYLKLLDFGLAKLVEQEGEAASTSLGMTFGDPHYMSPEQAKGQPVDRRADIYSMGCIAYEMITGHPPFHGGKVFDVLTRHVEETPRGLAELVPETPAWLERAIMRCLAKKADERYITVYRLVEALRQGTDSGVIMSDEIARRRPTHPPASVSRAMERLAARSADLEGPLPELLGDDTTPNEAPLTREPDAPLANLPTAEPASKTRSPVGAHTILGFGLDTSTATPSPVVIGSEETLPSPEPRAVNSSELHSSAPMHLDPSDRGSSQAAQKRVSPGVASGKSGGGAPHVDPNAESSSGLSAVWYADGDTLEGGGELSAKARAKLDKARGRSPSRTGILAQADDEFYEDFKDKPHVKKILIVAGALIAIAILAVVAWPSGDKKKSDTAAVADNLQAPAVLAADAAPALAAPGDAAMQAVTIPDVVEDAEPEVEPAAVKPKDVKPKDTRPRDIKPKDIKPKDVKPKDTKPLDTTPLDTRPADTDDLQVSGAGAAAKEEAASLAAEGERDLAAGDMLGAASKFSKARGLDPRNASAVAGLGEIALSQGAYAAAVGHLSKASKMRSQSTRIWTLLGEAYLGDGDRSKAAEAFKKALKLRPENARAREGYNEATR